MFGGNKHYPKKPEIHNINNFQINYYINQLLTKIYSKVDGF